jgi:Fe-S-cluster containining protein
MPIEAEKSPFYAQGLRFSCTRCSACCRFESGFVFLSEKDASLLGAAFNMEYSKFTEAYCRWVSSENGELQLSLKENSNYDCIFWAKEPVEGCMVYDKRPLQCRSFPFWPSIVNNKKNWDMTARNCPGMGKGTLHSRDAISEWLVAREKEPIISRNNISREVQGVY